MAALYQAHLSQGRASWNLSWRSMLKIRQLYYKENSVKAKVELKSSIPIGAKVEISPKGFFLH